MSCRWQTERGGRDQYPPSVFFPMQFATKVSVYSESGTRLYSVYAHRARHLFASGEVDVCEQRRALVFGLKMRAKREDWIPRSGKGNGFGGARYTEYAPVSGGGVEQRSGAKVHRHRDEVILSHQAAFVEVAFSAGAQVRELSQEQMKARTTCLYVSKPEGE